MSDSENESPSSPDHIVNIRRILVNAAPPRAAHLAGWTLVGEQILLEIGYFDLLAASQQRPPAGSLATIDWLVTDRFILDLESGERIGKALHEMAVEAARRGGDEE